MSLVIGILQSDYLVFCSDSRLNGYDGNKYSVQKVFKINDSLIVVRSGDFEISDMILNNIYSKYGETGSFDLYVKEAEAIFHDLRINGCPNVSVLIGGITSERKLAIKELSILNGELISMTHTSPIRRLLAKDVNLHIKNVKQTFKKEIMSIDETINAVQKILDLGILIDDNIDNKIQYAYIQI